MNVRNHDYKVIWSEEDEEYVATCDSYPSLSNIDECPVAALEGLLQLVAEADQDE